MTYILQFSTEEELKVLQDSLSGMAGYGGKEAQFLYRQALGLKSDELYPYAIAAVDDARLAAAGSGHSSESWRTSSLETEQNQYQHVLDHAEGAITGDDSENHLSHLVCRAVIWYAIRERASDDQ